jgi:hypothetical protein
MQTTMTAIYGGGPFYSGNNPDFGLIIADLAQSGFTTVVELIHLGSDGTIQLAPEVLVQNAVYIGDPAWPGWLNELKSEGSSVNRILFCLGGASVGDFNWIKELFESEGVGPGSSLYENFKTLKATIPALDGIDLDDETTFDQPSTVAFCKMLSSLGYQVTFCPFASQDYWVDCLFALNSPAGPGPVTGFNLQCYAGGTGNIYQLQGWIDAIAARMGPAFPAAAFVNPGLWCRSEQTNCQVGSCPSDVSAHFAAWRPTGIQGGFIWLYDDLQFCAQSGACGASGASGASGQMGSQAYASAIVQGLSGPTGGSGPTGPIGSTRSAGLLHLAQSAGLTGPTGLARD